MRKKLKDVCMFYSGTGFPIQYQGQTKGEYPFYKVGDIANNAIAGKIYLELCNNYISSDVAKMIKGCILPKDTVVFAKIGEALKLNRRAITSCDCLIDNNAMGIAPKLDSLRIQYFYFCMKNLKMQTLAESTTVPSVRKTVLEKYEIEVPSLVEQEEIEKKLTLTQKIIEKRRQELSYLDEIIKARFVEMFGDPVSNSYGFPEATLPELGELGRGVSKYRPRNDSKLLGGDYPLIQTGDVANAGLYITSYGGTYSELGLKQSKMWNKGTLCITIAANIAKTAILEFDACFPDSVVGFIANEKTNNIFIHYWFSFFQAILESQAPESAQKNINLKILSELKVIVPKKEKQDEFVEFIEQVYKSKFDTMTFAPIYDIINLYLHTHFYQGRR